MKFGEVLKRIVKEDSKFSRKGWNGAGQFISLQVPDKKSKMKSPYIYISPADKKLVPWVVSQTDLFADDWFEVKEVIKKN